MGPDLGAEAMQELLTEIRGTLKVLKLETDELENDGVSKVLAPFNELRNVLNVLCLDENELDDGVVDALLGCNLPNLRRLSLKDNMELEELDDDKKEEIRAKFKGAKVAFDDDEDDGDEDDEEPDADVDDLAAQMASLAT